MTSQVLAYLGILGFLGIAEWKWADILPPTTRGRALLVGLFALLIILPVWAVYRLLGRLEDEAVARRAARDAQRAQLAVSIQQLFEDGLRIRRAVRKSSDQQTAAAVKAMKGHLEEFRHEARALTVAEAGELLRIHGQIEDALTLPEHRFGELPEQIHEPILRALMYSYEFGGGSPDLDREEIAAIERWRQIRPSRRQ